MGMLFYFRFLTAIFIFLFFQFSWALCTKNNNVKLRRGPGSSSPISWVVSRYTPLVEIKRLGNWVQVQDMDGELHWVHSSSVTSKIICVSVKYNSAKIRKTPGEQGELAEIVQIGRYTSLKRLDIQGEWQEVESSWGETFWINERAVWRPVRMQRFNF